MVGWGSFNLGSIIGGSPVAEKSGIAAVSRMVGYMETWWLASNGSVQGAFWYDRPPATWEKYELAAAESAISSAGIAAVSRIPGHMEVWWIGPSGSIEGCWWSDAPGGGWNRYQLAPAGSAVQTSAVCAQSRDPNHMHVWWVGPQGSIEEAIWELNKNWKRSQVASPGAAALSSSLSAVTRIPTTEEMWWIGPGGSVEGAFWYEGDVHWTRYEIASAGSASIGAGLKGQSRVPGLLDLFWIHPNGSVQVGTTNIGNPWTRYQLGPPGSAAAQSGLTALARTPTTQEVWWVAPDGSIQDAYWYQGMQSWTIFTLAPAGSASHSTHMASVSRYPGTMEVWYASTNLSLTDIYWYDVPHYNFSVDTIQCNVTRSRNTDTLYISASVTVAGRDPVFVTRSLGDHAEGSTYPSVMLADIPVADDDILTFSYVIVNNGHSDASLVLKTIEDAAKSLAKTAAQAAAKKAIDTATTAAAAAIGALIGSPVPVIGPIIGAGLGFLSSSLLFPLIDMINPNCDGPIGAGTEVILGSRLRQTLDSGRPFERKDHNAGIDSPAGCGANSDYYTTWSIKRMS
ncbi:hypothetical protein Forpe1208_v017212 [Fusarium oxysporum f. sp. rapae]|uniref:Fucose-specific lectin n=1 Tax=Fusarium oxysporum f. sp. rapae TaxID=485398 RepID=A0A8J5NFJ8_FUSOX|nr:hypothetical protein Forpe1208_v017212 [Fusarium oxysporum f. sp. rapae]